MTGTNIPERVLQHIWSFVRGDTPPGEFENWAYQAAELETVLPHDLYLEVIALDYRAGAAVFALRKRLGEYAWNSARLKCRCPTLPNLADVAMGEHEEVFRSLEEMARRGEPA